MTVNPIDVAALRERMARTDGGPAFPSIESEYADAAVLNDERDKPYTHVSSVGGMSLRDYFAGQYIVANSDNEHATPDRIAADAYAMADAMLAARERV